jgi:hypothetical protein
MAKREEILAQIATALGTTTLVVLPIHRSRVVPLERSRLPAIVVEPVSDNVESETPLGFLQWNMSVRVILYVLGDVPDQVADPIAADIHAKIMSNTTLNGLVIDIMPVSVSFDLLDGDQPRGAITMNFSITYRTTRNSVA